MRRELRKKYVEEGSRESRFMVAYSVLSQYFRDSGGSVVHCSTVEHEGFASLFSLVHMSGN